MHGYQCEICGASLDPGETCDCEKLTEEERQAMIRARERIRRMDKPTAKGRRRRRPYYIQFKTVYRR